VLQEERQRGRVVDSGIRLNIVSADGVVVRSVTQSSRSGCICVLEHNGATVHSQRASRRLINRLASFFCFNSNTGTSSI
jgi:translation initiation factor 6 (eIF-6)